MVICHDFYTDDPSLNPTYSFFSGNVSKSTEKEVGQVENELK